MIDIAVVDRAVKLKKEMDAAYLVFKKLPTIEAAAQWTTATRAYHDYCTKVMDQLVEERIDEITYQEDILTNFDKYKECTCCGTTLLFPTKTSSGEDGAEIVKAFVAGPDFVEGIPGYCYTCLVDYCTSHECDACEVCNIPISCVFKEVKNLHVQEEA
jgi:hypothetical protein